MQHTLQKGFILEGKYEIVEVLGEGAFGITYKAYDKLLDRYVVIKEYMPESFAIRENTRVSIKSLKDKDLFEWGLESFISEAKSLAKFNHPNIVKIDNFFKTNNTAYFVMPFEEGIPLDEYIKQHPNRWSEKEIIDLLVPLLNGLKETHKKSLIHRDIKPANIFIRKNGMPVLIDFGAAREALGEKSKSITQILTPPYAPVEQYGSDRKKQGPWSDIYALGMVAYRLIYNIESEKLPASPDRQAAIVDDEKDPLTFPPTSNVSTHFIEVIKKATAIRAKDRYQNAKEMIEDLMRDKEVTVVNKDKEITEVRREDDKETKDKTGSFIFGGIVVVLAVVAYFLFFEQTYRLRILTTPNNAKVQIVEPKLKYYDGIELKRGKYHIKVSKSGYETYFKWIELDKDRDIYVTLKSKIEDLYNEAKNRDSIEAYVDLKNLILNNYDDDEISKKYLYEISKRVNELAKYEIKKRYDNLTYSAKDCINFKQFIENYRYIDEKSRNYYKKEYQTDYFKNLK